MIAANRCDSGAVSGGGIFEAGLASAVWFNASAYHAYVLVAAVLDGNDSDPSSKLSDNRIWTHVGGVETELGEDMKENVELGLTAREREGATQQTAMPSVGDSQSFSEEEDSMKSASSPSESFPDLHLSYSLGYPMSETDADACLTLQSVQPSPCVLFDASRVGSLSGSVTAGTLTCIANMSFEPGKRLEHPPEPLFSALSHTTGNRDKEASNYTFALLAKQETMVFPGTKDGLRVEVCAVMHCLVQAQGVKERSGQEGGDAGHIINCQPLWRAPVLFSRLHLAGSLSPGRVLPMLAGPEA